MSYSEFYFDLKQIPSRILRILRISQVDYPAQSDDFRSVMHSHDFYELLLIQKGRGKLCLSNDIRNVAEKDLIIVPPEQEHYEITVPDSDFSFLSIAFISTEKSLCKTIFLTLDSEYGQIKNKISELLDEARSNGIYCALYCQNETENLLIHILRKIDHVSTASNIEPQERLFYSIHQIREFLDNNFYTPITGKQLANLVSFSPEHFIRKFKALVGQTPMQYIINKRIDAAVTSLTYTNKSVKNICYEVGFSDINNFIRQFKKKTGLTPQSFRAKIKTLDVPNDKRP